MDDLCIVALSDDNMIIRPASQAPPQAQDAIEAVVDLFPAELEIKQKIDDAIGALRSADKELHKVMRPGLFQSLGYEHVHALCETARQREEAQETLNPNESPRLSNGVTEDANDNSTTHAAENHASQLLDSPTEESLSYDHETCLKMASDAIARHDHPAIPKELNDDISNFYAQATQVLGILSKMDLNIHKFLPDRSIYSRFNFDRMEDALASLRQKIVRQDPRDAREIRRLALHGEYVEQVPETFFVDTEEGIKKMLCSMMSSIVVEPTLSRPDEPALSIDTEGHISLLQILLHEANEVYLIDFTKLGGSVFTTTASTAQGTTTLKDIFESEEIMKLLWDCRGDSAMFEKFHAVTLRCVLDVQLMDLATRTGGKSKKGKGKKGKGKKGKDELKTVKAMGRAFHERCTELPFEFRNEWLAIKDFGKLAMNEGYEVAQRLFDETGGSISRALGIVGDEKLALARSQSASDSEGSTPAHDTPQAELWAFDIRPLPTLLEQYASNDVTALPKMYAHHINHETWNAEVMERVWRHSEIRMKVSGEPGSEKVPKGGWNKAPVGFFEADLGVVSEE